MPRTALRSRPLPAAWRCLAVPQHYAGDYFGGHQDQILVGSMNDAIALLSGADALPEIGFGTCAGTSDAVHGFGTLDNFANNLLALETKPTTFGKAPSENRSTYMQALELARPIRGENVTPPGQSGYIKHLGMGEADAHMGD